MLFAPRMQPTCLHLLPERESLMIFSLITSTVGRTAELQKLLASIDQQTCRSFELVVVDQNTDDRLVPILEKYQEKFRIVHARSGRGVSRGRNVGVNYASGQILTFPDDDCWYPADLLEKVVCLMDGNAHWGGLAGKPADGCAGTRAHSESIAGTCSNGRSNGRCSFDAM